jgi:AAA ATPase domain
VTQVGLDRGAGCTGHSAVVDQQVVGRAGLVAQLDRFVRGLAVGPESLVIEGEAGIGKTTLWQAGVAVAEESGYRVLISRPAESETALVYSGLADLLAHEDESSFEGLPVPQRRALEVALHLSEPTGRSPEPRAIFAAFGGVLRGLSLDAPVLVAVDDQQWLVALADGGGERSTDEERDCPVSVTCVRAHPVPGPRW